MERRCSPWTRASAFNTDNALCDDFCADCLGGGVDADLLDVANSVPLLGQSFA